MNLGATITLAALEADPDPIMARLRAEERERARRADRVADRTPREAAEHVASLECRRESRGARRGRAADHESHPGDAHLRCIPVEREQQPHDHERGHYRNQRSEALTTAERHPRVKGEVPLQGPDYVDVSTIAERRQGPLLRELVDDHDANGDKERYSPRRQTEARTRLALLLNIGHGPNCSTGRVSVRRCR